MKKTLLLAFLAATAAFAYVRDAYVPPDGSAQIPLIRPDADKLQIYLNTGVKAGATSAIATPPGNLVITAGSDPFSAVQTALTIWNAVPGTSVRFKPLLATDIGSVPDDLLNVIVIAASAGDLSVVGAGGGAKGALATTRNVYVLSDGVLGGVTLTKGSVIDSDIVINPNFTFAADGSANTSDFQSVMTHELGHLLGSSHSAPLGAVMYPFRGSAPQRVLSADDAAFATAVYPAAGVALGTIAGKITQSDGTTAVKTPIVTFLDQTSGTMVSTLGAPDGSYSLLVPVGNYIVYAEPFNTLISPDNFSIVDPKQVSAGYLPAFLGGAASPQTVAVTAGATTNAPVLRTSLGTSSLGVPLVAPGISGANGDIRTRFALTFANVLTSGQTIDLGFEGGGVDASTTFQIFGPAGVKVNGIRLDTVVNSGGAPLIRVNVTLPTVQKSSLATLLMTKGTNVSVITGAFIIVPPTPIISSVQDSQSGRKSIVGGSWIAIYGSNLAPPALRTWGDPDFINGNLLPKALDGVNVSINGQPASIYYTLASQMGIQAPADLGSSGQADVVISHNGSASKSFKVDVAANAPSLFFYQAGGKTYAAATHANGQLIGDPAVTPGSAKALQGETIVLYVNGLGSSPSGSIIGAFVEYTKDVNVSIGGKPAEVKFKALTLAGTFQVNVVVPTGIALVDQLITVSTQSLTSPGSVTIPIGQ